MQVFAKNPLTRERYVRYYSISPTARIKMTKQMTFKKIKIGQHFFTAGDSDPTEFYKDSETTCRDCHDNPYYPAAEYKCKAIVD